MKVGEYRALREVLTRRWARYYREPGRGLPPLSGLYRDAEAALVSLESHTEKSVRDFLNSLSHHPGGVRAQFPSMIRSRSRTVEEEIKQQEQELSALDDIKAQLGIGE